MKQFLIGVDVGTGSARAGLFDSHGVLAASKTEPIVTWKPREHFVEQSSADIWRAVCKTVRAVVAEAGVDPGEVAGISFDATCSLVVLDRSNLPLTVDIEGDNARNVIVWMDHRALDDADDINAGGHEVLRYVGGRISPEMETPKLRWLKRNLPNTWSSAGKFLDLADFLTFHASGVDARSLCTVTCKWTYIGHEGAAGHWDRSYFDSIGILDCLDGRRVVDDVRPMGTDLGPLTADSAADMGLSTNCRVGMGIIDAHAGALGLLGAIWEGGDTYDLARLETGLALIGGTSNCHMAVSREPRYIDGIWGPYFGAMVPGMWLTEGGQSSAGSAIDHVIGSHANAGALAAAAAASGSTVYQLLNSEIARLQSEARFQHPALLTRDIHVLPYFLGNRSPNADPHARATMEGLTLDDSIATQALLYYATVQGVAYGTRDIVRAMNDAGFRIDTALVTGGGTKNPLWLQEHADATGLTLSLSAEPEAVLLGSAMLAAVAAGIYPSVPAAMGGMARRGPTIRPNPQTAAFHDAKFRLFRQMYQEQLHRRSIMASI